MFFQYRRYSPYICLKSLLSNSDKVFVFYLPPLPIIKCNIVIPHHRLSETERRPGAGALPGRHLPLRHHLPGLPNAHATRQAGRGLRLREAAAPSHLAQPGLHGPAAAVRDGRVVQGMRLRLRWRKRGTLGYLCYPAQCCPWTLSNLRDVTNWNIPGVSPANGSSQREPAFWKLSWGTKWALVLDESWVPAVVLNLTLMLCKGCLFTKIVSSL